MDCFEESAREAQKCAYCGKELKYKEMQVDHLEAKENKQRHLFKNPDRFENLMPSCRRCNHYKRANTLNFFRGMIDTLHETGYIHADILEKNVLVKVDPNNNTIQDITLTDFGLMDMEEDWKANPEFLEELYNYHSAAPNNTRHYFQDLDISLEDVLDDPRHLDYALLYYLIEENNSVKKGRPPPWEQQ